MTRNIAPVVKKQAVVYRNDGIKHKKFGRLHENIAR
jgi:hypothetical protein